MLRLIKAELFKLRKTRSFMVLCIIAIGLGVMNIGINKLMSSDEFIRSSLKSEGMTQEQQDQYIKQLQTAGKSKDVVTPGGLGIHMSFKDMFKPTGREAFYGSFGSGVAEIFLAVLIGAMVGKEYSSGTIKNTLAYGNKREHYYIAKLISISAALAILIALMVLVTTLGTTCIFGWGESFTFYSFINMLKVFIAAVLVGSGAATLIMLFATLTKSNGSTIGIGIGIFVLLPTFASFLYGKFDWYDKIYKCTISYNWSLATAVKASNGDVFRAAVIGVITMIIGLVAGIAIFKKQDIK